jgi:hypothetical protein
MSARNEPELVDLCDENEVNMLRELGCAVISLAEEIKDYSSQTSMLTPALEKAIQKDSS